MTILIHRCNPDPLQGQIYGHNTRYGHLEEENDGHPFMFEVMAVLVSASFKPQTNLEQYDRSIDP